MKNLVIVFCITSTVTSCTPHSESVDHTSNTQVTKSTDTVKSISNVGSAENGKKLFWAHCRQCHAPMEDLPEHGLGLRYVFDRLPQPGVAFFKDFVGNSAKLKKEQSPYALKLDSENDVDYEHSFKDTLSDTEFDDLIAYIKSYSKSVSMP